MTTKLLLEAIAARPTPRRPLWIMRQAGRYLPEYRALRAKHEFKALAESPELATEVTLMPIRRFPLDAAIVFADIMSPLPALGVEFDFDPGPVVAQPIRDEKALAALRDPAREEIAPEVMRALALTKAELPAGTALLGFCGGPRPRAAAKGACRRVSPRCARSPRHDRISSMRSSRGCRATWRSICLRRLRPARTRCRSSTRGPACCRSRTGRR